MATAGGASATDSRDGEATTVILEVRGVILILGIGGAVSANKENV